MSSRIDHGSSNKQSNCLTRHSNQQPGMQAHNLIIDGQIDVQKIGIDYSPMPIFPDAYSRTAVCIGRLIVDSVSDGTGFQALSDEIIAYASHGLR